MLYATHSPVNIDVPFGDPLHQLLRRQRDEHAIGRYRQEGRNVHYRLPIPHIARSPGTAITGGDVRGSGVHFHWRGLHKVLKTIEYRRK